MVMAVAEILVSMLVAVTFAPVMAAPAESPTSPLMEALCAVNVPANNRKIAMLRVMVGPPRSLEEILRFIDSIQISN